MQPSKRLFWDINVEDLSLEEHARFIVERTINRGNLKDWKFIKETYGWNRIKDEAIKIRSMDKKTLNFLSTIFKIPLNSFRCYSKTL